MGWFFCFSWGLFSYCLLTSSCRMLLVSCGWIEYLKSSWENVTLPLDVNKIFYLRSLLSLTYIIPFLQSLSPLLLLFLSLVRHAKNLQLNLMGSRDSSTEAHKRAMKMVTTFLLLFIIYFISTLTASWSFIQVQRYQAMMLHGDFLSLSLRPLFHYNFWKHQAKMDIWEIHGILNCLRKTKPLTLFWQNLKELSLFYGKMPQ